MSLMFCLRLFIFLVMVDSCCLFGSNWPNPATSRCHILICMSGVPADDGLSSSGLHGDLRPFAQFCDPFLTLREFIKLFAAGLLLSLSAANFFSAPSSTLRDWASDCGAAPFSLEASPGADSTKCFAITFFNLAGCSSSSWM